MRLIVKKKCKSKNVKIHHPKIVVGIKSGVKLIDDFIGGFDGKYEHGGIEPMKNKDQTGLQWAMGIEFGT